MRIIRRSTFDGFFVLANPLPRGFFTTKRLGSKDRFPQPSSTIVRSISPLVLFRKCHPGIVPSFLLDLSVEKDDEDGKK